MFGPATLNNEELEMLRRSARALLSKHCSLESLARTEFEGLAFDTDLWERLAALGWLGISVPEELGGSGGNQHDALALSGELGRTLCAAPFVAVAVAASFALEALASSQSRALVRAVARGARRPVLAVSENGGTWLGSACQTRWDGRCLSGRKWYVEGGAHATHFIVAALDALDRPVVVLVDAASEGVIPTGVPTMAGAHWSDVRFDRCLAEYLGDGWRGLSAAVVPTAIQHAGWCAGAAARLLEDTVAYVSERRQFDVPIGSFQSVQHRLADCDLAIAEATSLAHRAATAFDGASADAVRLSSTAFVRSAEAFVQVARSCHQVWGGMGFSTETHVHLFSRRAKVAQHAWGGVPYHLGVIADALRVLPLLRDRYELVLARRGFHL